ncbi:MAG: hypothetical protein JWM86_161 [Thermoleophilia bacterium]|nr:hypothetical protein [Thermoleophilia bacterium]
MPARRTLLSIALGLIALGAISFALQPVLDPKPDSVCVADGSPSSGFTDDDKDDCNVSIESYRKIADHDSKPKPFRIIGLVLVLAGIVTAVVALARGRGRSAPRDD